jgi:hypothetical protein
MPDKFISHLEKSAQRLFPYPAEASQMNSYQDRVRQYVRSFEADSPAAPQVHEIRLNAEGRAALSAADEILREWKFHVVGPEWRHGTLNADFERDYSHETGWISTLRESSKWKLSLAIALTVSADGKVRLEINRRLPTWIEEFQSELDKRVKRPAITYTPKPASDPLLAPGCPLQAPFTGSLLDYSGCARENEVADLVAKGKPQGLPLGQYAFGFPGDNSLVRWGSMLYLNPFASGGRREHNGTIVCAPQNSGKTELIVRWARSANRLGYNVFLVDVKGNLYEKLRADDWRGDIYYVSTNPRVEGQHSFNPLSGIDVTSPEGRLRISQLAAALLPREGFESGEQAMYYENRVAWLSAMIQVALVCQVYWPYEEREVDLSDIYTLAASEEALWEALHMVDLGEHEYEQNEMDPVLPCFADLFDDLAVLLQPGEYSRADESKPPLIGQRAEYSYRWMTENLVRSLKPFQAGGTLYSKVSGFPSEGSFDLDMLAGLNADATPTGRQVTVILAARVQDMDDARTMLSLYITRLQQVLFDRIEALSKCELPPVLLLLDETRRIRNFKANEYVTFAREAQAGCVIVYQALDQVGDERQVAELLENIGSQIYLGSLVGNTARYFVSMLPKRYRGTFSSTKTAVGGAQETLQTGQESIDYFSTADLYRLPAGHYPALVYLNDQPRRKPILVTMEKARIQPFVEEIGKL